MPDPRVWELRPQADWVEISISDRIEHGSVFGDKIIVNQAQGGTLRLYERTADDRMVELPAVASLDLEQQLEEAIVIAPALIEADLLLVARQLPTAGGPPDLLAVDSLGCLVILELKRGILGRHAITQALDYASDLVEFTPSQLKAHIASRSGENGIPTIRDVDRWLAERDRRSDNLLPARMMLAGLGVDETASRIVRFLQRYDLTIEIVTFLCFVGDNATYLVKPDAPLSGDGQRKQAARRRPSAKPTRADRSPTARAKPGAVEKRPANAQRKPASKTTRGSRNDRDAIFAETEALLEECFAGTPRTTKPQKYGIRYDLKGLVVNGKRQRQFLTGAFIENSAPDDVFLCIFETAYSGWNSQYNELKNALKAIGVNATWWNQNNPGMRTRAFRLSSLADVRAAREHVLKFFREVVACLPESRA